MDAYIEAFSSKTALQAAIDSYGVSEDAFLSSTYAGQDNQASTMLALLSVKYDEDGEEKVGGSRFVIPLLGVGDSLSVTFNTTLPVGTTVSNFSLRTNKGRFDITNPKVQGNKVVGEMSGQDTEDVVVSAVVIAVDSSEYRLEFLVYNSDYAGGGIE